jgi:hypothetical protein
LYTLALKGRHTVSTELDELIKRTEGLSPEDRQRLLEHLSHNVSTGKVHRQWREIRGAAPYPLVDEDAQTWVSRTRHEGDEHRESQLRNGDH